MTGEGKCSIYNVLLLFSLKKWCGLGGGIPAICHNMDEPGEHYTKWNKLDTEEQILHDPTCIRNVNSKTHRREKKNSYWEGVGEGNKAVLVKLLKFQFYMMSKS